jgi:hypothetical protein
MCFDRRRRHIERQCVRFALCETCACSASDIADSSSSPSIPVLSTSVTDKSRLMGSEGEGVCIPGVQVRVLR